WTQQATDGADLRAFLRRQQVDQQSHSRRHRPDLQADRLQEMRREDRSGQHRLRRDTMKFQLLPLTLLAVFGLAIAAEPDYPLDAPAPDGRRPGGTISREFTPPPLHDEENKDIRRERNYPEQPPTIPHTIRGYQVDKNGNRCLTCHSRAN